MNLTYHHQNTSIHQLHPLSKLIWVVAILISTFIISDPIYLVLLFLTTLPFVILGKIQKTWWSFIRLALWLSLIIIAINIIANPNGTTIIFQAPNLWIIGTLHITLESLLFSFSMCLRLLITLSSFAILTLTINPDDLLHLILRLKIPYKTVLTTTITIRFIPTLLADLHILEESIQTRGYQLHQKKTIRSIKQKTVILLPLLSNSLDRSIQIAEAMESRGFGSTGEKTLFKTLNISTFDRIILTLPLLTIIYVIALGIFQFGSFSYYPTLPIITLTTSYVLLGVVLTILAITPALLSPLKQVIDLA